MKKITTFALIASLGLAGWGLAEQSKEEIRVVTVKPNPAEKVKVLLKTNKGDIVLELDAVKAPISTENFLKYVEEGQYDQTIFHRVINGFMIQGGGFTKSMTQKAGKASIKNEAANGLKNDRGTVAMARTNDPDSASNQFFINLADNNFLNHRSTKPAEYGYAVFGKVVKGMDVVDAIARQATTSKGPHSDVPVDTIEILKAEKLAD